MNTYEIMLSTEYMLISGESPETSARRGIVNQLLSGRSSDTEIRKFHAGISSAVHRGVFMFDEYGLCPMYPEIYIPPYVNMTEADMGYSPYGAKYRLLTGYQPKTLMLSANAYELGILRILALFAPDDATVRRMCDQTMVRLDSTALGHFNAKNDYYCISIAVMRFISAAFPDEKGRIRGFVQGIEREYDSQKRPKSVRLYKYLAYSELPPELIRDTLISRYGELTDFKDKADPVFDPLTCRICERCLAMI